MKSRAEEYRAAVRKHGSQRKAAKALGVDQSAISRSLKAARKRESTEAASFEAAPFAGPFDVEASNRATLDAIGARAISETLGPLAPTLLDFAHAVDRQTIEQSDDPEAVAKALKRTRERAAAKGYAPDYGWNHPVPDPHVATGLSTFRQILLPDGTKGHQWVKSSLDQRRYQEILQLAVAEFAKPLEGLGQLPPEPAIVAEDLCNVIVMGDPHFGMLAWAKETLGADYDLQIAESIHSRMVERLISEAPDAAECVVVNLGDALHADNYDFLTQSGHRLDADSRLPRAIGVVVRTFKRIGEIAALKHRKVFWKNVSGNHDRNATPWINEVLRAYWSGSERIDVDCSPASNLKHRFGKVLLGMTHGDRVRGNFKKKSPYAAQDFLAVMAADWGPDWGQTLHHEGLQGHIHTENTIEGAGGILRSFQTAAPGDAWHAAQRYRSGKSMTRLTYHAEHGYLGSHRIPVSMVYEGMVAA